jgi:arylsulfatase A-like enzyme
MFYGYHGHDYYEEFIKVPIIIKYPHNQKNRTILKPASLIDIVPTILDFYSIDIPAYVQGNSLLNPNPKQADTYIVSEATSDSNLERKMIRIGDLKYIIDMAQPKQKGRLNWDKIIKRRLFDLGKDPLEKRDLYSRELKYKNIASKFEDQLKKIISDSVRLNTSDEETVLDEKTIQHLKAMGYL